MIIELTLPHNTEVLLIFERIGLSSSTKNLTIASLSAYVVSVYVKHIKRLYPQQQFPKKVPNLHICCQDFLIDIEEDPFEAGVRLILKVGVLEQRERLKKLEEFKEKLSTYEDMNVRLRSLHDTSRGQSFSPEFLCE
ncbi:CGH_1_collapsed_G0015290.mRNA.1.CDS.1 [Saccharomyces cerevisiae]|nr:CGH_1_collapsed_G0015290.mRNA.1.CDS.1 [Saccharomyces cerevisiae]